MLKTRKSPILPAVSMDKRRDGRHPYGDLVRFLNAARSAAARRVRATSPIFARHRTSHQPTVTPCPNCHPAGSHHRASQLERLQYDGQGRVAVREIESRGHLVAQTVITHDERGRRIRELDEYEDVRYAYDPLHDARGRVAQNDLFRDGAWSCGRSWPTTPPNDEFERTTWTPRAGWAAGGSGPTIPGETWSPIEWRIYKTAPGSRHPLALRAQAPLPGSLTPRMLRVPLKQHPDSG